MIQVGVLVKEDEHVKREKAVHDGPTVAFFISI